MSPPAEPLQAVQLHARALLTELRPLAAEAPEALQPTWAEHLDRLDELVQFLASGGMTVRPTRLSPSASHSQWMQFGRLLRDKRNAAGLSRVQLARRARLSDATVKFTEIARHPPSRATLIRLIGVSELKLCWADVPGHPVPPSAETSDQPLRAESTGLAAQLTCLLTPSSDSLPLIADLARFLNGAGGCVEQTHAYLDHCSAADYLMLCQNTLTAATLRSRMPLGELAQRIVATSDRAPLQVIALGAGDGDHEPRFLRQTLLACEADDLLLLDVPLASASCDESLQIKARHRLFASGVPAPYVTWLSGPIWRHCKGVERVDFRWRLETRCPVPGSYALHAVATVKSSRCADRQFSLFRFGRYDPTQLAECLSELGWNEVAMVTYGGEHSLRLYRKRAGGTPEEGR